MSKVVFLSNVDRRFAMMQVALQQLQQENLLSNDSVCAKLSDNTVIIADEIHPSMTANMDTEHIAGIISEKGGDTSHASILARRTGKRNRKK